MGAFLVGVHLPLVVVLEEGRSLLPTGHPCCVLNSLTADLVESSCSTGCCFFAFVFVS